MSPASLHRDFIIALALGALATLGMIMLAGDLGIGGPSTRLYAPLAALLCGVPGAAILLLRLERPSAAHGPTPPRHSLLARIPALALLAPAAVAGAAALWLYLPEVAIVRARIAMVREDFAAAAAMLEGPTPARLPAARIFERGHIKGQAHLRQWTMQRNDDAWLMTGLEAYREALHIHPGHSAVLGEAADLLDALGAHAEALHLHDKAVENSSGFGALLARGASHRARGEFDAALKDADAAVATLGKATAMPPHYHRGRTLFDMGRYAEADAEFLLGLQSQSNYPWVYFYMACAGVHQGKLDQALEDYTKGVAEYDKRPQLPTPVGTQNYDRAQVELAMIRRLAKGETVPTEEVDGLCRHFHAEFPIRARSPLLPATLDMGVDDEEDEEKPDTPAQN